MMKRRSENAARHQPVLLRIEQKDSSGSVGWTHHTTRARSLTFDLPNHSRDIDRSPREVSHDETETDRQDM